MCSFLKVARAAAAFLALTLSSEAGAQTLQNAPRFRSLPFGSQGIQPTMDFRLFLYGSNLSEWRFFVLRPELLRRSSPAPLLGGNDLGNPLETNARTLYETLLSGDATSLRAFSDLTRLRLPSPEQASGKALTHSVALPGAGTLYPAERAGTALIPEPGTAASPIHVVQGEAVTDTYRLILFAQDEGTGSAEEPYDACEDPIGSKKTIGRMRVEVVVHYPNGYAGATAPRIETKVLEKWKPLRRKSDGKTFCARHPTLTADGRLLVFEDGKFLSYTWNPKGGAIGGWSDADDLTKMHLNEAGTRIQIPSAGGSRAVAFRTLYPIADRPLTDARGRPFRNGANEALKPDGSKAPGRICVEFHTDPAKERCNSSSRHGFVGGYPWITPDGTDLVYTAVAAWELAEGGGISAGAIRSAASIVGQHTGWRERLIDGPFNPNRASEALAREICSKFAEDETCSDGNSAGRTVANRAISLYSRIRTISPGVRPSMWGPYSDVADFALPIQASPLTLPLIGGNSGAYDEVDLSSDASRYLELPMGETIERWTGEQSYPSRYEERFTADISGNVRSTDGRPLVGELQNGAAFPQEYRPNSRAARDESVGAAGQAIYFPPSSTVEIDTAGAARPLSSNLTFEFWLKRLAPLPGSGRLRILSIPGVVEIEQNENGRILARFQIQGATEAYVVSSPSWDETRTLGRWNHIALTRGSSGAVSFFLNGVRHELPVGPSGKLAQPTEKKVLLGPGQKQDNANPAAVYLLDEVKITNRVRSQKEIAVSAFVAAPQPGPQPSGLPPLPRGLKAEELQLDDDMAITPVLIEAGRAIFEDTSLSSNGLVSCQTCHLSGRAFTDGRRVARGIADGTRNTPTIINRAFSTLQFLDGRAATLAGQSIQPFTNPLEMGLSSQEALKDKLLASPKSRAALFAANPSLATHPDQARVLTTTRRALNAFLVTLLSGDSIVDRLEDGTLKPTTDALKQIVRGRAIFRGKGRCLACHTGSNYTDERFHVTGLSADREDLGRGKLTRNPAEKRAFKTPTLRDIALTAPYLHDGSAATLQDVVERYRAGMHQEDGTPAIESLDEELRPLELTDAEAADLVEFLKALTGHRP